MKQLTTYNRAAAYLNSIFDSLNDRYFESALSRPVITIQSTPRAYGHFTLYDAWSVDGDKGMREINIGAGTLSRPIENVVATLLHVLMCAGTSECLQMPAIFYFFLDNRSSTRTSIHKRS